LKGCLLESWEVTPEKVVWHVRPGIYWAPNEQQKAWMPVRELTAEDMVAYLLYFKRAPAGVSFSEISGDIYTTGKYTLEIEYSKGYDYMLMYLVGYEDRSNVEPPETVVAGASKWENQVGTGPWMFKEYVVGAYMSYVRNPNYWNTTTIDGKEYELPFADELICPIIPDASTQMAALRTGVLDWIERVPAPQWETLAKTAPGLLSATAVGGQGYVVALQVNQPPFDNLKVRQALMIGTDMKALNRILGLPFEPPIDWHPLYQGDPTVYIPLEELPPESRKLYDYNPELAMDMLEEALGPPDADGVFLRMDLTVESTAIFLPQADLIADQWAKIGVEVDLKVCDPTTYLKYRYERDYRDAMLVHNENASPLVYFGRHVRTNAVLNWGWYSSPEVDELIDRMMAEIDPGKRNALAQEAGLIVLNDVPYIPSQIIADAAFWWPWLKNYYGEFSVQDNNEAGPLFAYIWIDQALKKAMGY